MISPEDYRLFHARLSGTATPAQEAELRQRLSRSAAHRESYAALTRLWETAAEEVPTRNFSSDRGWQKLVDRLDSAEEGSPLWCSPGKATTQRKSGGRMRWGWAATVLAAACWAVILIVEVAGVSSERRVAVEREVWLERVNEREGPVTVSLSDGTRVVLNHDSELRYPKEFGADRRIVELSGEAFFEVERDEHRPFEVHSAEVVTRVLGTQFDFRAFRGESEQVVSLVEGSVEVARIRHGVETTAVRLEPLQQYRFDRTSDRVVVRAIEAREAIGWMHRELYFRDEPLEHVARALADRFDVEIQWRDDSASRLRVTAEFEEESLPVILEILELTTGVTAELDENPARERPVVRF